MNTMSPALMTVTKGAGYSAVDRNRQLKTMDAV